MIDRIVNRTSRLGDLERYNRLIDDFNTDFVVRILSIVRLSALTPALD
jgi:hypothetical protein